MDSTIFTAEMVGDRNDDKPLEALAVVLKQASGIDLRNYKQPFLLRRLNTRLRKVQIRDLSEYLAYLQQHPGEIDQLISALTVNVTRFFRNTETFEALREQIYPELFRTAHPGRPVRIWSLGCAGGEEAFSVALQLLESPDWRDRFSLLGTDVSPQILQQAKAAAYEASALEAVPEALQQRYFSCKDGVYQAKARLRRSVRFRRQDVLGHTAYPAADLVLCRNVLIYFDRQRQAQILRRIAACLSKNGVLVLGRSETLAQEARPLFKTVLSRDRIYQRLSGETARLKL